ncbi:MAG: hypothetical protein OEV87_09910 [Phycisphaerae bacterium]|nr:hypothetical protein [Phycisphaerae bacterium]
MKNGMLVSIVVLLAVVGMVRAGDAADASTLHGAVGIDYTTKYLWRGFDVFSDKSAIHPYIDLDLWDTGFGLHAIGHRAASSGHEINERWDYTLSYKGMAFEGEPYMMSYMLGYRYFNYPDRTSHTTSSIDLHEVHGVFAFPALLGVENLVPAYVLVKLMPANSGTVVGANQAFGGSASGFAHIFMLDYSLPYTDPITGGQQDLKLHSEAVYNDGVSPNGATDVDNDWSNAVFGISTTYDLGNNLSLTPGVYYQSSWEDTVNTEDEFWASFNLMYKF